MSLVPSGFEDWIGRRRECEDFVTERLVASFRAIFGDCLAPQRDDAVPLGLHWCLMPEIAAMADLGGDGHPAKNIDLPPVPLPRRMWAGGIVESTGEMRAGDLVRRISTVGEVARKEGRTGQLWFVSVDHDYHSPRGLAIRERQTLVYREAAQADFPPPPNALTAGANSPHGTTLECADSLTLTTTPTLLFRYSAITFNGHRIHYDLLYARDTEGYPGLLVHGPLQATLLMNLAAKVAGSGRLRMEYRGLTPAVCGDTLKVCAGSGTQAGRFWTEGPNGQIHMDAKVK